MRILHLNQHLAAKGGVETYLLAALPLLQQQGVRCILGYAEGDPALWPDNIALPALGKVRANVAEQEQLRVTIQATGADIIHVHNIQNADLLSTCMETLPTVLTNHDYRWLCPANTFFFKRSRQVCSKPCGDLSCFTTTLRRHCLTPRPQYALFFYRRIRQMTNSHQLLSHTIAPSPVAAERLMKAGWKQEQITVLPYFCPLPVRTEPRPLPARPTISFVGRIAPNKGQDYFIQALGQLPSEWQGIMAGDIDAAVTEHLQQLAIEYGCANRLELRPWAKREEVLQIMDDSTIFVFPSLWQETLGIVALEALSRGVPVVASDITGVGHWLEKGACGRVVPAGNGTAIAEAVQDLSRTPQQLLAAGAAGIKLIAQGFTPEYHLRELISLYRKIMKQAREG